MFQRLLPVRAFALAALASLPAFAADYTLDGAHSRVGFGVKHMMVSTVKGAFKSFSGTVAIDDADLTKSTVKVEIDTYSFDAYRTSASRRLIEDSLEKQFADQVTKLFYDHEPKNFGQGVSKLEG